MHVRYVLHEVLRAARRTTSFHELEGFSHHPGLRDDALYVLHTLGGGDVNDYVAACAMVAVATTGAAHSLHCLFDFLSNHSGVCGQRFTNAHANIPAHNPSTVGRNKLRAVPARKHPPGSPNAGTAHCSLRPTFATRRPKQAPRSSGREHPPIDYAIAVIAHCSLRPTYMTSVGRNKLRAVPARNPIRPIPDLTPRMTARYLPNRSNNDWLSRSDGKMTTSNLSLAGPSRVFAGSNGCNRRSSPGPFHRSRCAPKTLVAKLLFRRDVFVTQ